VATENQRKVPTSASPAASSSEEISVLREELRTAKENYQKALESIASLREEVTELKSTKKKPEEDKDR
jgi:predicted  nucleic acid-binding Zn-ribbon protein